jgi:plastocyanin
MVLLRKGRPAIARTALVILTLVVVVVGGAIGVSYPKSGQGTSTTSASSISTSSSASTSSTRSSSATTSTSTATHTPSAPLFTFNIDSTPRTILLYPGANLNYSSILVIPTPSNLQGAGLLGEAGIGSELVAVNVTAPSGLYLHFFGSNLTSRIYDEVGAGSVHGMPIGLRASPSIAPGDYTIAIQGTSGTFTANYTLNVKVVQYIVIANLNAFNPRTLTVPVGSTVYWLNMDNSREGVYTLAFETISVASPFLHPGPAFESWEYTFTTPGTYPYRCSSCLVPVSGTIVVTN